MASRRQVGIPLLWLSARYTPGVDGASISSVTDLAAKVWTGDATKQPVAKRDIATVKNALRFDGINDCLYLGAQDWTAYSALTVYAVMSAETATSVILETSDNMNFAAGSIGLFRRILVAYDSEIACHGNVGLSTRVTSAGYTGYTVDCGVVDLGASAANEAKIYVNGVAVASSATVTNENTGTFGNHVVNLGSRNNGTAFCFAGDICEVIVFVGAHDATTVAALTAELRREWGV